MKVGDCANVWWAAHPDGQAYTWMDPYSFGSRESCDAVAKNLSADENCLNINRLGVWKVKALKHDKA